MNTLSFSWYKSLLPKRFFISISLKLFLAFWLVILTSVLISYLATMHFKQSPIQEQANPKQLALLTKYTKNLSGQNHIKLKEIQRQFRRNNHQGLIIKKISNNQIYLHRKHARGEVKDYLMKHPLENPVTIDFGYTKITSSQPIIINNKQYQLFVSQAIHRKPIVNFLTQLPLTVRIVVLLMISFISCWLLAKTFTKPLIAIQKASNELGEGKLTTRLTQFNQRSDEFGDLARSFNQMAEQLESNITSHQRLLGDVSHELRSPLTRLQLAVALAEKNSGNAVEQQKHLNRCEIEVERLDEMIADVLTLSRLEHSPKTFTSNEINLNDLITDVINDCQYFATSKDVTITFKEKYTVTLLADDKILASAISNIVNNAVKYSSKNNVVTVELNKHNNKILLSVSDQGPGVPDEMITKLFTPFFRVADARDRNSGGTGLGLAIAQQAILLHQGEILHRIKYLKASK